MVRTPPGIYPHGLGTKNAFWDRLRTSTEHISATEHDINNRKETYQSTETAYTPLNLVNFGSETAENGWSVCPPPNFSHWETASLTAWTLYNRQQANVGTRYVVARAYSLEHQNAGRAHAGLCYASSNYFENVEHSDNDREEGTLQSISANKQHYKRLSMISLYAGDVSRQHQSRVDFSCQWTGFEMRTHPPFAVLRTAFGISTSATAFWCQVPAISMTIG